MSIDEAVIPAPPSSNMDPFQLGAGCLSPSSPGAVLGEVAVPAGLASFFLELESSQFKGMESWRTVLHSTLQGKLLEKFLLEPKIFLTLVYH